ncbi:MAG: DUF2868 domain-containing protein, partial [Phycisphaerales bacterium]|nr:DUF2868 domain-containing protein [Phycisphaerales bacterium]
MGDAGHAAFDARLVAESLGVLESLQPDAAVDDDAARAGRARGGSLEDRLIARALAHRHADGLRDALHHAGGTMSVVVGLGMLAALGAGVAATVASLTESRDGSTNIVHALLALLGLQTVILGVWFVAMLALRGRRSTWSLGGFVLRLGRRLAARLERRTEAIAAADASARVMATGAIGRWTFSAVSHGLWIAFNLGAVAALVVTLSTARKTFTWETTILSSSTYSTLVRTLATVPRAIGFDAPDATAIAASEWPTTVEPDGEIARDWSQFLIGAVVVYGLVPRLALLGLSLVRRRAASRAYRLDESRPCFLRHRAALLADETNLGVIDPAGPGETATVPGPDDRDVHPERGPGAIVSLELDRDALRWPPRIDGIRWRDLGACEDRTDQHRVEAEVAADSASWSILVVAADLTTTPDRGVARVLSRLVARSEAPVGLLLSGGQHLRDRFAPTDVAARVDAWRALATAAGIRDGRVIEADLEHLTATSADRVRALLGRASAAPESSPAMLRRQAFALVRGSIDDPDAGWDLAHRAELHRAIARLFGHDASTKRWFGHLPTSPADVGGALRRGADRVVDLL